MFNVNAFTDTAFYIVDYTARYCYIKQISFNNLISLINLFFGNLLITGIKIYLIITYLNFNTYFLSLI